MSEGEDLHRSAAGLLLTSIQIAIKFDPFMYLSLAIPQNKKWTSDVYLFPFDQSRPSIKVGVPILGMASI